jgi:hypothetical protein
MRRLGWKREEQGATDDPVPTHRHRMLPGVTDDLVGRLVEASELHGDFVLSSGKRSSIYFDKFMFLTRPDL